MHFERRVLVTGGAGFLGSHLCERLLADGSEVLCVDNFFTGARRNVEPLLDHKYFELMRHDVTFPLYVEVGEIYNLACPASPIHSQQAHAHVSSIVRRSPTTPSSAGRIFRKQPICCPGFRVRRCASD